MDVGKGKWNLRNLNIYILYMENDERHSSLWPCVELLEEGMTG